MRDKAIGEMLKMLSGYFNQFIITGINYERAATLEEISQECDMLNINYSTIKEAGEFVLNFKKRSKDECLVVLGSMYLIGEIKAALVN
jgi:folylpolyglutamate synthase/dihydropteroate synthase